MRFACRPPAGNGITPTSTAYCVTVEVIRLENQAVFLETSGEISVTKQSAPEFWMLYQQSVLLALKQQGALDEQQYALCMDTLRAQRE